MMRRICFLLIIVALAYSCHKDDPISDRVSHFSLMSVYSYDVRIDIDGDGTGSFNFLDEMGEHPDFKLSQYGVTVDDSDSITIVLPIPEYRYEDGTYTFVGVDTLGIKKKLGWPEEYPNIIENNIRFHTTSDDPFKKSIKTYSFVYTPDCVDISLCYSLPCMWMGVRAIDNWVRYMFIPCSKK